MGATGATPGGEELLRLRAFEEGARRRRVVEAVGEVDLATIGQLEPLLIRNCEAAAADGGGAGGELPCVAMDLRGVAFLDSAGMGLLVRTRREFAGRCDLVLVAAEGGHPERALRLGRLEKSFRIVRSTAELDD